MDLATKKRQRKQINPYYLWGMFYVLILVITSPILPIVGQFVDSTVLPLILKFHKTYFLFKVKLHDPVEQHFILQVLTCNVVLIAFSASETFLRGLRQPLTLFDFLGTFVLGLAALANALMFLIIFTEFEFLYFTFANAAFYVLLDILGIWHSRSKEQEMASTFKYSLGFVDGPTLLVCLAILAPTWVASVTYLPSFTDGIGAGILLFSGMAWTSLMVFFVAPELKPKFQDETSHTSSTPSSDRKEQAREDSKISGPKECSQVPLSNRAPH